jgi:hypothetical protein
MRDIIRRGIISVLPVLLFGLTLNAGDITGKWAGGGELTLTNGETRSTTAYLEIRQNGQEVTGNAGPGPEQLLPISKAKIDGDKLTFEVIQSTNSGDVLYTFEFTVSGGKMEGTVKSERFTGKLSLKRSSD